MTEFTLIKAYQSSLPTDYSGSQSHHGVIGSSFPYQGVSPERADQSDSRSSAVTLTKEQNDKGSSLASASSPDGDVGTLTNDRQHRRFSCLMGSKPLTTRRWGLVNRKKRQSVYHVSSLIRGSLGVIVWRHFMRYLGTHLTSISASFDKPLKTPHYSWSVRMSEFTIFTGLT